MKNESFEFLSRLLEAPSPSGYEAPAQRIFRDYVSKFADVTTDVLGNVYSRIAGTEGSLKVMIVAHTDEIGFQVKYIDDKGFIYFAPVGGVDAHLPPGQRVNIHTSTGSIKGVIGKKPIHLMETKDRETVVKLESQYIDIGASDRKEAEKIVSVGDPVTFAVGLERLTGNRIVSRGFDDKAGVYVVAEVIRKLSAMKKKLPVDFYGVSSVQEEIGLRGGTTSSYTVNPDVGICVEVDFATDQPDVERKHNGDVALGKGPILSRGANINPVLHELLVNRAKKSKIPYQLTGIPRATGTDANPMQISRNGVATALVKIPLRYMHTPVEVVDTTDLDNAVELIASAILDMNSKSSFIPM